MMMDSGDGGSMDAVWSYVARMGSRMRGAASDGAFFGEGDAVCGMRTCQYLLCPAGEGEEELLHRDFKRFSCPVPGCPETEGFTQLWESEAHYAAKHRHACSVCGKSLPSNHLLDLHLTETHDSFFQVMSEKRASFSCFLETCQSKFWNATERKDHCVKVHQFQSANFKFDSGGGGGATAAGGSASGKKKKKKKDKKEQSQKVTVDGSGDKKAISSAKASTENAAAENSVMTVEEVSMKDVHSKADHHHQQSAFNGGGGGRRGSKEKPVSVAAIGGGGTFTKKDSLVAKRSVPENMDEDVPDSVATASATGQVKMEMEDVGGFQKTKMKKFDQEPMTTENTPQPSNKSMMTSPVSPVKSDVTSLATVSKNSSATVQQHRNHLQPTSIPSPRVKLRKLSHESNKLGVPSGELSNRRLSLNAVVGSSAASSNQRDYAKQISLDSKLSKDNYSHPSSPEKSNRGPVSLARMGERISVTTSPLSWRNSVTSLASGTTAAASNDSCDSGSADVITFRPRGATSCSSAAAAAAAPALAPLGSSGGLTGSGLTGSKSNIPQLIRNSASAVAVGSSSSCLAPASPVKSAAATAGTTNNRRSLPNVKSGPVTSSFSPVTQQQQQLSPAAAVTTTNNIKHQRHSLVFGSTAAAVPGSPVKSYQQLPQYQSGGGGKAAVAAAAAAPPPPPLFHNTTSSQSNGHNDNIQAKEVEQSSAAAVVTVSTPTKSKIPVLRSLSCKVPREICFGGGKSGGRSFRMPTKPAPSSSGGGGSGSKRNWFNSSAVQQQVNTSSTLKSLEKSDFEKDMKMALE